MSKTYKKFRFEDETNSTHHFKFQKSRQVKDQFKNIDKYIRNQDFDALEDLEHDEKEFQ